jgi:transcriptional regulator with XRE-family HTH domain
MQLPDYLTKMRLTVKQFAEQCGVSYRTIYRWIDGTTSPSLEDMSTVERVTQGCVTGNDWVRAAEQRMAESANEVAP